METFQQNRLNPKKEQIVDEVKITSKTYKDKLVSATSPSIDQAILVS